VEEQGETLCCATALRKASRRLTQLYDEALAPTGLRSTQLSILAEIARAGRDAPTLSGLAQALVLDRSALGHNLRPLERDGLISLQAGSTDRRQRLVVLTPKGRRALAAAAKRWRLAQARVFAVYGKENADLLRTTLARIAHNERLGRLTD
jgi:DNA-binding MarR family transcriptional regulator